MLYIQSPGCLKTQFRRSVLLLLPSINLGFNNILLDKVSKLCSRSKHKFPEKILQEVHNYDIATISDRSKLLNKVDAYLRDLAIGCCL